MFLPQACVLCGEWVLNDTLSPLCESCYEDLAPLGSRVCFCCGIPVPGNVLEEFAVCSRCRHEPQPYDFARAWGAYSGELRRLIRRFKFDGFQRLAAPLAKLLETNLGRSGLDERFHWVVPIPSHPARRRQRGFDQTLLLARELSRRSRIPLFTGLYRIRDTRPQRGLDQEQRRENLRGAFTLKCGTRLAGQNLLLIDDVMTTGTTAGEVSSLLRKEADPGLILVLVVARTLLQHLE